MKRRRFLQSAACGVAALGMAEAMAAARKPNIVIILTDDQGYADVSFNPHHPQEVSTPNIDAIARSGVVCTQGYVTGHVCAPTRAGLMTGRYQQRFGVYTAGQGGSGLPLDETLFPNYLKPAGYVSGAFGKWHMGLTPEYNAINRGFDEFYGFMGRGAHPYFDLAIPDHPIYRNLEPIEDKGYLTHRITEEAVSFIQRHKAQPFFAYVAFNAVHSPAEAPAEDIARFDTGDDLRNTLMAMLGHLDAGIGKIVQALKDAGVYDNTLLFFLSDNGGSGAMHANNAPLRGFKQDDYEGGVRVPFVVSWPGKLPAGATCDVPVFSIDILPTSLAAVGIPLPAEKRFDGVDMMPALEGRTERLREDMFWSSGHEGKWAVRSGDWKLVAVNDKVELFNLADDLAEKTDLAGKYPEKVADLRQRFDAWLAEMAKPADGSSKRWAPGESGKKRKRGGDDE